MPHLTVEAVPAQGGRPPTINLKSDLNPAEALVLLERAKAALLQQPVPALDGAPQVIAADIPPGLAQKLKQLS